MKPIDHRAWFLVLPVVSVAFRHLAADDHRQLFRARHHCPTGAYLSARSGFAAVLQDEELHGASFRQIGFLVGGAGY